MGTFYAIGIIRQFTAIATKGKNAHWGFDEVPLSKEEWINGLSSRIDPDIFDLFVQEDGSINGFLKNDIFQQHINGFYETLRAILGENRNGNIDYYENEFCMHHKDIHSDYDYGEDRYLIEGARPIHFIDKEGFGIQIKSDFIMLMLEGKVLVEEFSTDPVLINYLFRHSNIDNPLKGAIISGIVG